MLVRIKDRIFPWSIPGATILTLAIVGAILQSTTCIYIMIGVICIAAILVAFNKLEERYYPYLVFGIGLALLYQTTLMSPGLVGTDVHYEYYFAWQAQTQGWDISIPHSYNSAFGTVFVAPQLANLLHIDVLWIFKVLYPLLFAFVPLLLYYIYKGQFGAKVAFLSAFFFVIIPTYILEMVGIPRQQLAELMFTICAFLIITSKLRLGIKVPLIVLCAGLGIAFHYTMGPIILLSLAGCALVLLFFKRRTFPVRYMCIILVLITAIGVGYYSSVASGSPLRLIAQATSSQISKIEQMLPGDPTDVTTPTTPLTPTTPPMDEPDVDEPKDRDEKEQQIPDTATMSGMDPFVRVALGLDFFEASLTGKAFRVFQYLTQICIILGIIQLIRRRRMYSPEYLAFITTSIVLLLACVVIPRFASVINTTRMYHIILIFLAPAIILGGQLIFRNVRVLAVALLIPYFLFTSGVVFEAAQVKDISVIDTPYSYSLSHQRVPVTIVSTRNDIAVRDWAVRNDIVPIYLDIGGLLLFSERISYTRWKTDYDYLYRRRGELAGAHIYLCEQNTRTQTLVFKPIAEGIRVKSGMRQAYSFEDLGITKAISNGTILYRRGDAMIVKMGSEE